MNSETKNTVLAVAESVAEVMAKKLFHDVVVKAVIADAVAAIPILGSAILNPFVTYIVTAIATKLYDRMKLIGGVFIIKFEKDEDRREYDKATLELKKVLTKDSTPEELQKAKDEFKKRLSDLVRINLDRLRES